MESGILVVPIPDPYSREPRGYSNLMPEFVQVSGQGDRKCGELSESLALFTRRNREVGEVLTNIAEGRKESDIRAAYVFQPYPTLMYHADGRTLTANDKSAVDSGKRLGFRSEPYVKPQVEVVSPEIQVKRAQTERDLLQTQLVKQADLIEKLAARLAELEK